ncbi:tumor necrosis factor receptor superfamily member 14-like isoform 2-T2 [Odontesthes bonariensis]|uniref:tumor necrosis factor receptor superfamily member 14-like n=1 Tax=Odontesthes bonariensis TaxID=219752 RepID=UPI003F586C96
MTLRGKALTAAASVLMVVMRAFSVHALTCRPSEYETGNKCCPLCPPGSRIKSECNELKSTSCFPCTDGTYMDKFNELKECVPCTTCDSGLKVKQSCAPTSDTVCGTMEGFFCVDPTKSGCAEAQKHKSCDPGQYISSRGTASTDSECSACSSGTFSDGTLTSCQPHTQCESENLQLIKAGNSSADAECGENTSNRTGFAVAVSVFLVVLLLTSLGVYVVFCKQMIYPNRDKQASPQTPEGEEEKKNLRPAAATAAVLQHISLRPTI